MKKAYERASYICHILDYVNAFYIFTCAYTATNVNWSINNKIYYSLSERRNKIRFNFLTVVGDFWWTSVQIFAAFCWSIFSERIFVHSMNSSKFSSNCSKFLKIWKFFWFSALTSWLIVKLRKRIMIISWNHLICENKIIERVYIRCGVEILLGRLKLLCANADLIHLSQAQCCLRIYSTQFIADFFTTKNRRFLNNENNFKYGK